MEEGMLYVSSKQIHSQLYVSFSKSSNSSTISHREYFLNFNTAHI